MRRIISLLVLCVIFLVPVFGQNTLYTVQEGDTLWSLAGMKLGDPMQWQKIVQANPFLNKPGRQFQKGDLFIVLIKKGEDLAGLGELGIIANPMPLSELGLPAKANPMLVVGEAGSFPWPLRLALIILLALAAMVVAYYFAIHKPRLGMKRLEEERARQANRSAAETATRLGAARTVARPTTAQPEPVRNPAIAGPAYISGGFRNMDQVSRIAQETAQQIYAERYGQVLQPDRFTVISRRSGTGKGRMMTCYADGTQLDSILNGDPAWAVLVEFPNGTREELFSLQECANPLRTGQVDRYLPGQGFRFTPDPEKAQPPAPPVVPAPAVATVPVPARPHIVAVAATGERMTVLVEAGRLTVMQGDNPSIVVHGDFTLRNENGVAVLTHSVLGELRLEFEVVAAQGTQVTQL